MQVPTDEQDVHHAVSRNIAVSLIANILYLATRLMVPPIILHYVSLNEYGIWSYCFLIIGYLSMSAFGVSNVYIRYTAVFHAKGDLPQINRLITTGLLSTSLLCLIFIPIIWFCLPWFIVHFNIQEKLYQTAFILIFGTILTFLFDLTLNVFSYILQSLQQFVIERIIWTISFTLETFFIIVFLMSGLGIYSLLYAYIIRIIFASIGYAMACYKVLPSLSIRFRNFDYHLIKLFYCFGGIVQLSGLIATINRGLEKVFAGLFIGPVAAGLFDLGEKFPLTGSYLPSAVSSVILPTSAHLHTKEMHDRVNRLYLDGSRWVSIMTGMMMGFLAPFAVPLVVAWLGTDPKYQIVPVILAFFTLPLQMHAVTGPGSSIYKGINKPSRELFYSVLQFALIVIASLIGLTTFGYSIIVIVVSIASMILLSAIIYLYTCNRYMKVSQLTFIRKVLLPGLAPYVCGYGIFALMLPWFHSSYNDRWATLILFLVGFALYTAILIPLVYWVLLTKDERQYLFKRIKEMYG